MGKAWQHHKVTIPRMGSVLVTGAGPSVTITDSAVLCTSSWSPWHHTIVLSCEVIWCLWCESCCCCCCCCVCSIAKCLGALRVAQKAYELLHTYPVISVVVSDREAVSGCLSFAGVRGRRECTHTHAHTRTHAHAHTRSHCTLECTMVQLCSV